MKKVQIEAKVVFNKQVKSNYFRLTLDTGVIFSDAKPGQFIMVKSCSGVEPLLRRPLGVHAVRGKNIELLYEVVGPATTILSRKKPGEVVDILGPLGNGFDYRRQATGDRRQILVAGGIGAAPLAFLAEKIKKLKPLILIGAKTKSHILCEKEFQSLGCDVKIATDDGSAGFKGRVTELLENLLHVTCNLPLVTIYACGPRPMLEAVNHVSQKYKIPAQVSLEEHMSCGFGACLGCAINTIGGYKQVCKDGPVFDAQEIIW